MKSSGLVGTELGLASESTAGYEPFELEERGKPPRQLSRAPRRFLLARSHAEALIIYKLGFDQNYHTLALILPIKIVLCSKFH